MKKILFALLLFGSVASAQTKITIASTALSKSDTTSGTTGYVTKWKHRVDSAAHVAAIALKAPIDNPTFTGTPKISTDTIATRSYARSVGGGGGGGSAILYSSTGSNTDGAMTQAATTTALGTKVNVSDTASMLTNYRDGINTNAAAIALKANIASPTFTGTVSLPSTTSIGNVSSTEMGYVDGVTSAIQTQLDAKQPIITELQTILDSTVTKVYATADSTYLVLQHHNGSKDSIFNVGASGSSGSATTDASLLTSGTLADARLSSNVPLKNASNTFTGTTNTFADIAVTNMTIGGGIISSNTSGGYSLYAPSGAQLYNNGIVKFDKTLILDSLKNQGTVNLIIDNNGKVATQALTGFIGVRYLTSGTTYAPTSGTTKIVIQMVGGGGGGGGSAGVNSGSGGAAGGGAGAYVTKYITGISSATTYTVALGAAGTAGAAASSGTGGTGGSTTFTTDASATPASTTITAAGGVGGAGSAGVTTAAATAPVLGGTGGTGTNGDINGAGESGFYGLHLLAAISVSGAGGSTIWGQGGKSVVGTTSGSAGNNGAGYGAGGGGAASGGNTNVAGGTGSAGVIVIFEYK